MSHKRYDDELLRRLRNDIPIAWLIQHLGWPCKMRERADSCSSVPAATRPNRP